MLTKNDLRAISSLMDEKLESVKTDIAGLMTDMSGMGKDIKSLKRDMKIVKKDTRYMSGKFDQEIVYTRRRVERIETHLKLPEISPHQNN